MLSVETRQPLVRLPVPRLQTANRSVTLLLSLLPMAQQAAPCRVR
jgi:hypothetical protein